MLIKECTVQDAAKLARMNRQLIEDERSGNPMSIAQLEHRMNGFLNEGYRAYFFVEDGAEVGYALVKYDARPLYLRQFFIGREYRRRHYGRRAFRSLTEHLRADVIDIDVLPWNEAGRSFWRSCGFKETCVSMRYDNET